MARTELPPAERRPRHVAVIMDGNGRWARGRHLPRVEGHRKGAEALRRTTRACAEFGVPFLTVYAFSFDNWRRPAKEVSSLMQLLKRYLRSEISELRKNGVSLGAVGMLEGLPGDVREALDEAVSATAGEQRLRLTLALNYSGRGEIVHAARLAAVKAAEGSFDPGRLTIENFREFLWTADLPPVDLIIRTAGEKRLSDFILFDAAYAELYFADVLWPDFDAGDLRKALWDYAGRKRKFGALVEGG